MPALPSCAVPPAAPPIPCPVPGKRGSKCFWFDFHPCKAVQLRLYRFYFPVYSKSPASAVKAGITAHAMLDSQTAEVDKSFEVDGYKIMFPGDTSAPGYLVYNCRCRIVAAFDDMPKGKRRAEDPVTGKSEIIPDMSYQEWAAKKRAENAEVWDTYLKKGRNRSADTRQWNEYKSVLGNKIPNTIDKFQNLKYTEPENGNL